jgi:hypothetical protein
VVKIITLTGALTDTGEHGVTTVVHGNVVNQLHDDDGLADSGTTEKSDLTSLGIRSQQVNDLDAGHQNLLRLALLSEERGRSVDRSSHVALNRTLLIDRLADDVQNATKSSRAHRNHDRGTCVLDLLTTDQTLSGLHGNSSDSVLSQVLGNLKHQTRGTFGDSDLQGIQNRRKSTIELEIN